MSTIRDVAKAAKVSVATVSRVLNNSDKVNEETKKRVLETIRELDYKPNEVARSLFRKQSNTIALIVPDIKNPFFPEVARAVEDVLNEKEFTLILCNSDEDPQKEQRYLDMMKQKYVDGVIIVTSTLQKKEIEKSDIPIIALDRQLGNSIPSVSVDNFNGAREAVRHLKSAGCRKIAHIRGPHGIVSADDRSDGYLHETAHEPWYCDDLIVSGNFNHVETFEAAIELMKRHPDLDGIFAGNDIMAAGAIKAAGTFGKKVPEELAVIGFDGIDLCRLTNPEITTMAQPIYELGATAAKLILELIEGKELAETHVLFDVTFSKGQSTKNVR
ncbi:LacI family transcriptional regulator [Neobacillus notoginsengisoli]|uniref:LacI family transcriptional regulator n=1 Tax=Neobacillus notoginsengisoli TaxID=1578198 RepID=A0A417YZC6_9BACI|nr:LacI family DNA-binding transcriptional regulator [Neobacillus notoginsengisoli]RHW42867.1 LacI family transcriptional regulator [Neobacillus notoginsengisoli]